MVTRSLKLLKVMSMLPKWSILVYVAMASTDSAASTSACRAYLPICVILPILTQGREHRTGTSIPIGQHHFFHAHATQAERVDVAIVHASQVTRVNLMTLAVDCHHFALMREHFT
jgi:hypothetical protein